jgi:putative ABC transport system permease protein
MSWFSRGKQLCTKPHLRLIRFVGLIVPRRLRADWRQEWEAELRHREALLAEWDRLNWQTKLDLLRRSTSAFWDALWLQPKRLEDEVFQDLRYGARMLLKNPAFSLLVILTLSLGIGANTAIFSVVNAVLLRPLPYAQAEQLVAVYARTPQQARQAVAWPDLRDWQAQSQSFAELAAFVPQSINLTGRAEPARLIGGFVSADFFKLLRVNPAAGRAFLPGEDETGAERVAIVNHVVWRDRFGADPALIGQSLTLNGQPFTVVGIMPAGFRAPYSEVEVWLPIQHHPSFTADRRACVLDVLGRLKAGVSLRQAQAEMETIAARLARQHPETNADRTINLIGLQTLLVEGLAAKLWMLFAAVGFVLLIACANVANLTLSRAVTRQREMAVRAALGAGRLRLVRQLLTESVLLSLAGGGLGLLLGKWGMDALAANSAVNLPPNATVKLDPFVFFFTLGLALLTGLLFGLFPALRLSRLDLNSALKAGGRTAGPGGNRLHDLLVAAQLALALVLLVGAGLMVRSFVKLLRVNPGFDPANVLTLEYRVPRNKYPELAQQWRFHEQVVANVRALPGVQSAAVFFTVPHGAEIGQTEFGLPDRPAPPAGQLPRAQLNRADANYFDTLKIPLLRGRVFTAQDQLDTAPVVIINQTMAHRYWPAADPLGQPVKLPGQKSAATVIGVVGDVKHNSLDEPEQPQLYLSFAQNPHIFASLAVRTTGDALSFSSAVRGAIWAVDKEQPVWKVRTLEWLLARAVGSQRFIMQLLGALSLLALSLATVGVYGVLSYSVSQQTRAIGVRLALGAQPHDILYLVLRRGLWLALLGVALGVVVSLTLTRLMSGLLFGVTASDPLTFGVIALLLTLVAMLACYLPARRATRVDPIIALREE